MTREEAINQLKDFIILHREQHGWDVSTLNALDMAIKDLEKIRKAKKIIDDACFQHIVMSRADVLDEMFKNNLGEVADSVAEMNNVIYEVLEVLGNDA